MSTKLKINSAAPRFAPQLDAWQQKAKRQERIERTAQMKRDEDGRFESVKKDRKSTDGITR